MGSKVHVKFHGNTLQNREVAGFSVREIFILRVFSSRGIRMSTLTSDSFSTAASPRLSTAKLSNAGR